MSFPFESGPAPIPGTVILRERIPASASEKGVLVERAIALVESRFGLDGMDRFRVRLCLDEALQNALKHGNREDPAKTITLVLFETPDRWGAAISDEGEGFVQEKVPDPSDPESLLRENGRGILIMRQYMDEVGYYDGGRTVLLARAKRPGAGACAADGRGPGRAR